MVTLAEFNQECQLLLHETDEITRKGICVALCDDWLALIKNNYALTPEERMERLRSGFAESMAQQREYAHLRRVHGREEARRRLGHQRDLDYEFDKTQVFRVVGGGDILRAVPEFWNTIKRDIDHVLAAATWTLRWENQSGHAIAGFCGAVPVAVGVELVLHIYDPNLGEYTGDFNSLSAIFSDMWAKIPAYENVVSIHRASESS